MTILHAITQRQTATEQGGHDFRLSQSHYADSTQAVAGGHPEWGSELGPPNQEARTLLTEPPPPPPPRVLQFM